MPVHNHEIAVLFGQVADLLEIDGANPFRVRAYRNASQLIDNLTQSLADKLARQEPLTDLPGIGQDLADKLREMVATGKLSMLQELEQRLPAGLLDLLKIPQLGPKRVRTLYRELKIASLADLSRALEQGKVRALPGFGKVLESQLTKATQKLQSRPERFLLSVVEPIAESLIAHLKKLRGVRQAVAAGSFRRRKETVGDLDVLVTCAAGCPVMEHFLRYEDIVKVQGQGETRSTVILRSGLQVDIRVVAQASYGAALHYFTGSKAHNIALRTLAQKRKLKINEYGVYRGQRRIAGATEEELYALFNLAWIPPELREMTGEIEAALQGRLPDLITLPRIRGDLHAHTTETDGTVSLEGMVAAARARGYAYLAITDHSQKMTVAHGMDAGRVYRQIKAIEALNARLKDFVVLKGMEVDILEDGRLDLPDEVLADLDITVCSVHSKFNLPRERQTERIIRAMDNPYFRILGHPTGRLLGEREPYAVDMEKVIAAAAARGRLLELNAHPQRLDLTDSACRLCKEKGVRVAISTDAHSVATMDNIRFGIGQARRGWLEPADVINTLSWPELQRWLLRSR